MNWHVSMVVRYMNVLSLSRNKEEVMRLATEGQMT